jgi:GNAT superfamily N-acetyltransferase
VTDFVPAFEIEILNPWMASSYSALATRVFSNLLGLLGPGGSTLGVGAVDVGATIGGLPVGIALAEAAEDCFVLRWIFVAPAYRRLGIGRAILNSIESEIRQHGAIGIRSAYPLSSPDALAISRLFEGAGWSAGTPAIRIVCSGSLRSERWVRATRVPKGFSVFPWVGSSAESSDWNQSWVPQYLAPHRYRQKLEPHTSLGLSRNGATLGWLLTSKLGPEMICYESMFVHPDARSLGGARLLLAEGIRRQTTVFGSAFSGSVHGGGR